MALVVLLVWMQNAFIQDCWGNVASFRFPHVSPPHNNPLVMIRSLSIKKHFLPKLILQPQINCSRLYDAI